MEFPETFVKDLFKLALVVVTLSAAIYLFKLATSAYEASALNYSIGIIILGTIYFVLGAGFIVFGVIIALNLLGQKIHIS